MALSFARPDSSALGASVRVVGFLGILGFGLALVGYSGAFLERPPQQGDQAASPIYLPGAKFLRPVSLGYHAALGDILWFRTIHYFGKHYRSDRQYKWLAYMCDLVTDLDPRAEYVYRFGGVLLPWEAHQPAAGVRLLEKGVRALPDSWLMHYWLGIAYYLFMNDYDRAATQMRQAAELPGAHPNAARLATVLYEHQHGPDMTLRFLTEMEKNAGTMQMREVIRIHIAEAQLATDIDRLTTAVKAYRKHFGHAPLSLRALVDARLLTEIPNEPFGGTYLLDPTTGAISSSTGHQPLQLYRSQRAGTFGGNVPPHD